MKTHAVIRNGEIRFNSLAARSAFIERNEGKNVFIVVDEAPSAEIRRYFEGCLVPITFYTHPMSGWMNFRDAREALKLEFLSRTQSALDGARVKVARSTMDLSRDAFKEFVEVVARWLLENQLVGEAVLDAEEYKAWRDSAPEPDEVYPPLRRLKELYDREREQHEKWKQEKSAARNRRRVN